MTKDTSPSLCFEKKRKFKKNIKIRKNWYLSPEEDNGVIKLL